MRTCWKAACVHPLVGLGGGWGQNVIIKKHNMAPTNKNKRSRDNDQDSDTDSDNERSYNSCNNWRRFLVVESSSDDLPLSKLSPSAVQKGFQAVAGTLKSIKMLRGGSFLVECARKSQAMGLLKTTRFVDRPVRVSTHKALNSSRGANRCRELSGITEMEIRTELQEQGVVEVHRVTVKKDTEKVPTNTLTFNTPDLTPKRDHGWLYKGEGGLVCSQPDALLQLRQVWPHEPTLQGCCGVSGLLKR